MLASSATGLILGAAVSERERIASDLKERTIFLNSLIENSPFGIVVHDRDGNVRLYNDAFVSLFLYGPSEILGKSLRDLFIPAKLHSKSLQLPHHLTSTHTIHDPFRL